MSPAAALDGRRYDAVSTVWLLYEDTISSRYSHVCRYTDCVVNVALITVNSRTIRRRSLFFTVP